MGATAIMLEFIRDHKDIDLLQSRGDLAYPVDTFFRVGTLVTAAPDGCRVVHAIGLELELFHDEFGSCAESALDFGHW